MKTATILFFYFMIVGSVYCQSLFGPITGINDDDYLHQAFSVDFDNDGDPDILNGEYDGITWHKNDGFGSFSDHILIDWDNSAQFSVYPVDLDNNGTVDVISGLRDNKDIRIYINDGEGNFTDPIIVNGNAGYVNTVSAADLDNDGDYEILAGISTAIKWYEYGNGSWTEHVIIDGPSHCNALFPVDINNDGKIDIVAGNGSEVIWFENQGSGNFSDAIVIYDSPNGDFSVRSIYSSDFDNNGHYDVVIANSNGSSNNGKIIWYSNTSNGNFGNGEVLVNNLAFPNSVFASDVDNDNDDDIIYASDDEIAWIENFGNGNFGIKQILNSNFNGYASVYAIDLDSDNDNDIICGGWFENFLNSNVYQDIDLCENDSLYLFNEWIFSPGIYAMTYQNIHGGDSIVTATVEQLPSPEEFNIIGQSEVETFSLITYSVPSNPDVDYSFEVENGNVLGTQENSVEVQWGENGVGIVKAYATIPTSGCDTESTLHVTIGTGGINGHDQINILLYPNPANNRIYLETNLNNFNLEIIDLNGQLLIHSESKIIDVSGLESNVYFIRIFDKKGYEVFNNKLVIIK